ncbi:MULTISPECIES: DUF6896 domain-containing protein [unclassified Sphingobacterium]|uniref:DUF6896 domain-containing protein n=1 Tax=unclassified Sphingobacterium TaxID=2609468 RepID=UPI0029552BB7|nr:hypothetical protein [Sphingobacterium sp. UGAL515B_05]WON93589.1 hypothetical protein OK025_20360 [Sphingobacterium sp. UGAL515B_05]
MIILIIRKILNDYVAFIDDFKYQFSPNMEEFEQKSSRNRSGHIGDFKYQFHGAGCRLEKDGVICEFDFMPINEYPIKFSLWKMREFILTNKAYGIVKLGESELNEVLHTLVEDGTLVKLVLDGMVWEVYQI